MLVPCLFCRQGSLLFKGKLKGVSGEVFIVRIMNFHLLFFCFVNDGNYSLYLYASLNIINLQSFMSATNAQEQTGDTRRELSLHVASLSIWKLYSLWPYTFLAQIQVTRLFSELWLFEPSVHFLLSEWVITESIFWLVKTISKQMNCVTIANFKSWFLRPLSFQMLLQSYRILSIKASQSIVSNWICNLRLIQDIECYSLLCRFWVMMFSSQ